MSSPLLACVCCLHYEGESLLLLPIKRTSGEESSIVGNPEPLLGLANDRILQSSILLGIQVGCLHLEDRRVHAGVLRHLCLVDSLGEARNIVVDVLKDFLLALNKHGLLQWFKQGKAQDKSTLTLMYTVTVELS